MPAFDGTGFSPTPLLCPGQPCYSFGSSNDKQANCKFLVNNVALTSNVATITGTIVEGNIPVAGQLISVRGTANTAGLFNVSNVAVASATITASTGKGTITFALTHADVVSAADSGIAIVQAGETPEDILHAAGGFVGQAFAVPAFTGQAPQGRVLTWSYYWTVVPTTSVAIALEGAISLNDFDRGFAKSLDAGTSATGETKVVTVPNDINFLRLNVTAISSTTDVVGVGKILG